jgi:hypothetical protein
MGDGGGEEGRESNKNMLIDGTFTGSTASF